MKLLHQVGDRKFGSNFNTIDEIVACNEPLSFDGIYESVLIHADQLVGKDITLFFMGNYVGKDNSFDKGQPLSKYCDWMELKYLVKKLDAKLGYHGAAHLDLTLLSDWEVIKEITPPFPMDYYAYPHGRCDVRVAKLVEKVGYKEAWAAGPWGDGSQFQRKRTYLNW